ncbi:Panacea domain-containing protein [Roseateles noduli]|uniref:Panacea domain-containing protein n=1 Tax=Roseateles noduli TaxID=2052484 RepID=UPI003D653FF0
MPYSPAIVANAVLYRAKQRGIRISHLKLQKLIFFIHAWRLALQGLPAVDERPEAWEYGPVFETLFHRLKNLGHEAICQYIETVEARTNAYQALMPSIEDAAFWRILDQVMDRYGGLSASQLSTLGHEPGGPWSTARAAKQAVIPDDSIRSFYREKLQ